MWRVDERRGPDALEPLVDEWRQLERRCRHATPFQAPEWLIPWWHCFAHGELRVVTVRRDETLCALLPLLAEPGEDGHRVTLLGTGNTDHLDILADDCCREVATALAVDVLTQSLAERDWCDFEQLAAASPLMRAPAPFAWQWEVEQCDVCPRLSLTSTCIDGDLLPARRTADVRYARRRLARLGALDVQVVRQGELDDALMALFALHQARWSSRSRGGVLGDQAVRRFLSTVADGFLRRNVLRLYTLRLNGRVIAAHCGFQWRGHRYYYIGGFDPALGSLSVGSVLLEHAIRDATREGAKEFDFLRGAEAYKYRWGARDQPNYRRILRRAIAA